MKYYLKILLSLVCLSFTIGSFAQKDFQGKAYYFSKSTMDMGSWGGKMSEQQKKQIQKE